MSIDQTTEKIKKMEEVSHKTEEFSYDESGEVVRFPRFRKFFVPIVIILVGTLSFGLGRLSIVGERTTPKIELDPSITPISDTFNTSKTPSVPSVAGANTSNYLENTQVLPSEAQVVASKNGERYHFLYCSGAKQIKEENKIYFKSPGEAEAAGYTLALNCSPR